MKTSHILIATLTAALTLTAAIARAEVKGGEKLIQLSGSAITATSAPSVAAPMSCPKCQDVSTTVRDSAAKGASVLAGTATKTLVSHGCAGCVTTITQIGVGKQATNVPLHKCDVSMACCK